MHPEDITLPYGNDRFWAKVEIEGPDGCWLWTASTDDWGYGVFGWFGGKNQKAHRIIYAHLHGPIPAGMRVCHTCDTPPCVNPDHLFLGTDQDNMDDMARKGRGYHPGHSFADDHWTRRNPDASPIIGKRGADNPAARFTDDDIRAIRRRYAEGDISQAALAKEWDAEQSAIGEIVRHEKWTHVDDPDAPPPRPRIVMPVRGEATGRAKITADDVREMRRRHAAGAPLGILAHDYGIGKPNACLIVNRKTWKHID